MAEGFHSVADEETLKKVLALSAESDATPKTSNGSLDPTFESFLGQIVRYATGEDRYWEEPKALLDRALATWKSSETRKPGESVISLRIESASDWRTARLVLDVTTDDRPFLVDSISGALSEAGKPVSFFVNAIVDTARNKRGKRSLDGEPSRESMIHAEMDPPVDEAETAALEAELRQVLRDVSICVADWEAMRARLGACIAQLERARPAGVDRDDLKESIDFLKWLWDNRFAFLGFRRFNYAQHGGAMRFEHVPDQDLGILKDASRRILKATFLQDGSPSPAVTEFMTSGEPLLIAKTNSRSTVHRRVHMDYIGVKTYAVDGRVTGEDRFVGLFTADAYNRPATDIPLLRAKVRKVVNSAAFTPGGHNEKAIINILETFPRDEMFQSDIEALRENSLGVLRLYKRPRTKLFLRRDRFDRFVSALVFIPRDRFSSSIREAIGKVLAEAYDGRVTSFTPHFGDASLVRVHFIIGITPGAPMGPSIGELTAKIRAITRTWFDGLVEALRTQHAGAAPAHLLHRYEAAFDAGYRENTSALETIKDIAEIEGMGERTYSQRAFRSPNEPAHTINLKLYCRGGPQRLSDLIPKLENLGLCVVQECGYPVQPAGSDPLWIHHFLTEEKRRRSIDFESVQHPLEEAFSAILEGRTENDGFNALVVLAGLNWREAWLLRAMSKHALQLGLAFSQTYIEETLAKHAEIARALISAFHARFNPRGPDDAEARQHEVAAAEEVVVKLLDAVASLDEDRIIRRLLSLLGAMRRTNYYQRQENGGYKPYISFKVDTLLIEDAPQPCPYREIFVSGPRVDGVHLRFGKVARGGLRWSDRREDFRTEVLGLVKAQRVKNAVIVPTGSKGGFYPKRLPDGDDRNAIFEEGRAAYKEFIRGLLDLTDNIVDERLVTPDAVIRWEEPDPYLVVAADKGTATFSDTANGIAAEYGFWLGDAFASGGSAGYDHKVMGITARGAWEAVKRHFREMGKDIQTEPFTVAGVGDMSGDVFGNGMLLSQKIKLVAAFDHRDIFIDPDPDPLISWTERKRLFDFPRSSWADYDKSLITKGGGVFSRSAKAIPLSREMRELLGLSGDKATPVEVIRAILRAPVELFWLGGIGTYFKAAAEDHARVGDRANDAIRIDAEAMQMKVIGEGANLGMTQEARIVFARKGGRLNTDAIDNSAGVDSSDHEVNIKILVAAAIEKGELKREDRNRLLVDMTDNVALHVLRHNYDQTRSISLMERSAARDLEDYVGLMASLEAEGRLDRQIESLPDSKRLALMRTQRQGLTRPELAILLAYAKMKLFEELLGTSAPDDQMLEQELFNYFPEQLHGFQQALVKHRLRREIIATRLSNEIVDTCGATFAYRVMDATGATLRDLALAYEGVRRILDLSDFASSVDALDNIAPASLQLELYGAATSLIIELVQRVLSDPLASDTLSRRGVKGLTDQYKDSIRALMISLPDILAPDAVASLTDKADHFKQQGAPASLAELAARMDAIGLALDIVNLAGRTRWSAPNAAAVFFHVGSELKIDQARTGARQAPVEARFDRLAVRRLIEEISSRQAGIAQNIAASAGAEPEGPPSAWVNVVTQTWRDAHAEPLSRFDRFVEDLDLESGVSLGKLALLSRRLSDLEDRTGPSR